MTILSIETTCDETAIAILKGEKNIEILSNIVSSQIKIHAPFGGIVPSLAKREHQKNLIPVLSLALKESKLLNKKSGKIDINKEKILKRILKRDGILLEKTLKFLKEYEKPNIDVIAIAYGPGLEPALWPGINLVKALSFFWNIKIEKVNHIEAHILANWLTKLPKKTDFPAICLTVSGGHTQLILMKDIGKYRIIGETRDDAVGECFDKTARLLGLKYPGGPEISKQADRFKGKLNISLPRPMIHSKDLDFSFSGLKTSVLYLIERLEKQGKNIKRLTPEISYEIQEAIIEVLIKKTLKAVQKHKAKTVILAGGVGANKELRKRLSKTIEQMPNVNFSMPEIKYCTDNGVMIGIAGYFHQKYKIPQIINWKNLKAQANLRLKNLRKSK